MHIRFLHVCDGLGIFRPVRHWFEYLSNDVDHPHTYEIEGAKVRCNMVEVFKRFEPKFNVILFYEQTHTHSGIDLLQFMADYDPKIPVILYDATKSDEYREKLITDYGAFAAFDMPFCLEALQKQMDMAAYWNAKQLMSAKHCC